MCVHVCGSNGGLVIESCPTPATPWTVQPARLLCPWILQARILECVAISFSRGSSQPRIWTQVSCTAGRFFADWVMKEALSLYMMSNLSQWMLYSLLYDIGKDSNAGRDWEQEEKGMTEDEMAGWHHQLDARVWVNSRSWWWTGRPGVLQFMESQSRTRPSDWTELK